MEQLIFFAVIIFFSILESISRSRKAKQRQEAGEATEPVQFEWAQKPPWEAELPTYDADPSYDEGVEDDDPIPGEPLPRYAEPHGTATPQREMTGSEVVVDLWEEIKKLGMGGETLPGEAPTRSVQKPPPPAPRPEHRVHLSHAGYGTDPSSRAPSEQDGLDPLAYRLGEDASAVRQQLLSDDASTLRRAIILHEVLGPPKALRQDDF